jgi:hypothetical protein
MSNCFEHSSSIHGIVFDPGGGGTGTAGALGLAVVQLNNSIQWT